MKKRLLAILLAAAFMLPTFVAVFAEDWQWTWEDELSYSCNEIISGVYLQNDTAGSTGEIGDAFDKILELHVRSGNG